MDQERPVGDFKLVLDWLLPSCSGFRKAVGDRILCPRSTSGVDLNMHHQVAAHTGAVPAMKPEATAIGDPQGGCWKITLMFDVRRFCISKFRSSTLQQTTRQ